MEAQPDDKEAALSAIDIGGRGRKKCDERSDRMKDEIPETTEKNERRRRDKDTKDVCHLGNTTIKESTEVETRNR